MKKLDYKIVDRFDVNEKEKSLENETNSASYDDFIVYLGEFGRYQKLIYLLTALPAACVAFAPMSTVFTFGEQSFRGRCSISNMENDTYLPQNDLHKAMINQSIPVLVKNGVTAYSECKRYKISAEYTNNTGAEPEEENCNTWVYDKSVFERTVISENESSLMYDEPSL
ncbi:hypothetical protein KUTeg_015579 [Tegillarca granosa]|uniref:Uncharacterized protein n=1 Tax=Tegillarca granosa TaxID=220873 RepID=A0ABQ9EUY5_TEGGR|nr:hypothetical protein KUTeg_015579 [Tegillarca granosa]